MRPMLAQCTNCKRQFPSVFAMNIDTVAATRGSFEGNIEMCPFCGAPAIGETIREGKSYGFPTLREIYGQLRRLEPDELEEFAGVLDNIRAELATGPAGAATADKVKPGLRRTVDWALAIGVVGLLLNLVQIALELRGQQSDDETDAKMLQALKGAQVTNEQILDVLTTTAQHNKELLAEVQRLRASEEARQGEAGSPGESRQVRRAAERAAGKLRGKIKPAR